MNLDSADAGVHSLLHQLLLIKRLNIIEKYKIITKEGELNEE